MYIQKKINVMYIDDSNYEYAYQHLCNNERHMKRLEDEEEKTRNQKIISNLETQKRNTFYHNIISHPDIV